MFRVLRHVTAATTVVCGILPAPIAAQKPSTPTDIFEKASQAVVTVSTSDGFGSGVLIDAAGVVVTNLHVVQGAEKATVRLANGDAYDDVGVIDFDARKDLVLLKIKGFKLPVAEVADSDLVAIGHKVYAIGAPKGLELTLSEGIISGLRDSGDGYRVLQTSAAISSGSSGGGLFDEQGRLVGITSFKVRGGENLNFALPINYVRGMISTSQRLTLSELKVQTRTVTSTTERATASTDIAAADNEIPRLRPVYRSVDGALAVIEQRGSSVHVSYTASNGYIYGASDLEWDTASRAFKGWGTLDTVCGAYDKRVWKAPVQNEIYVVNANVIRDRWTQPTKVNCDKRLVTARSWQEGLWYTADSK